MVTTSLTIHVCKALWDREGFRLKVCHPLLVILFYIYKLDRLPLEQAEERRSIIDLSTSSTTVLQSQSSIPAIVKVLQATVAVVED